MWKVKKLAHSLFPTVIAVLGLLFCLSSCQREDVYSDRTFLSFKYKLEACADIHGQDPMKEIWFANYGGVDYSYLFDLSFANSFLDLKVEIIDGHATGKGRLLLTLNNGAVFEDYRFSYFCNSGANNWGGNIYAEGVPAHYGKWVYSIYWCRLNISCNILESQEKIELTFNFRGGEENPVPDEFNHSEII